ncbi:MAG: hypothetical protein ACOZIN_11565 [Myxococcota bacterium]
MDTENKNETSNGVPTDSANNQPTRSKPRSPNYDPIKIETKAAEAKRRAADITDPVVLDDCSEVDNGVLLVRQSTATLAETTATLENAVTDQVKANTAVTVATLCLAPLLKRITPGGKTLLARCQGKDVATTGKYLAEHFPEDNLGLPAHTVAPLKDAVTVASTADRRVADARAAKKAAIRKYKLATRKLKTAILMLNSSVRRYRASQGPPNTGDSTPMAA